LAVIPPIGVGSQQQTVVGQAARAAVGDHRSADRRDSRSAGFREAQVFVAVMGASSFSYAQATWTQSLADSIAAHVGALEAIGGSSQHSRRALL
jgi:transposase